MHAKSLCPGYETTRTHTFWIYICTSNATEDMGGWFDL